MTPAPTIIPLTDSILFMKLLKEHGNLQQGSHQMTTNKIAKTAKWLLSQGCIVRSGRIYQLTLKGEQVLNAFQALETLLDTP